MKVPHSRRFRMFRVRWTLDKITVSDLRHRKRICIKRSDDYPDPHDQVIDKLKSLGIKVFGAGMSYLDQDVILLSKDPQTPIK